MAVIPNPAATDEVIEAHLRLLREIELGRHRDGNQALKVMCASMAKAATHKLAPPTLTSLEPATAKIGDPSFPLRVLGTDFDDETVIVFNGHDEPTTLVSATEVTTRINMTVWKNPSDPLPVKVRGIGGESSELTFTFLPAEPPAATGMSKQRQDEENRARERERGGDDRERDRTRDRDRWPDASQHPADERDRDRDREAPQGSEGRGAQLGREAAAHDRNLAKGEKERGEGAHS